MGEKDRRGLVAGSQKPPVPPRAKVVGAVDGATSATPGATGGGRNLFARPAWQSALTIPDSPTGNGWDSCTGLGSPDGTLMMKALGR